MDTDIVFDMFALYFLKSSPETVERHMNVRQTKQSLRHAHISKQHEGQKEVLLSHYVSHPVRHPARGKVGKNWRSHCKHGPNQQNLYPIPSGEEVTMDRSNEVKGRPYPRASSRSANAALNIGPSVLKVWMHVQCALKRRLTTSWPSCLAGRRRRSSSGMLLLSEV